MQRRADRQRAPWMFDRRRALRDALFPPDANATNRLDDTKAARTASLLRRGAHHFLQQRSSQQQQQQQSEKKVQKADAVPALLCN